MKNEVVFVNDGSITKLKDIIKELEIVNNDLLSEEVVNHFIEIVENDLEIIIRGNTEGLTYLAIAILDLALTKKEYEHRHFDELSIFDKCDKELILSYKKADWE